MSHDLRRSLDALSAAGSARTTPPADVVARTSAAVERIRRRRPVVITTVTALSVLTAGAAAAAALTLREPVSGPPSLLPDRPSLTRPSDAAAEVALAPLDPTAVFPACGAPAATDLDSPVVLYPGGYDTVDASDPSAVLLTLQAHNQSDVRVVGTAASPDLVVVADGRVVGALAATRPSIQVPRDVDLAPRTAVDSTARLSTDACAPDGSSPGPLPAGHYQLWASQAWTVTDRLDVPAGAPRGPITDVPDELVARDLVGDVWVGPDGRVAAPPVPAQGWPSQADAYALPSGARPTIVWLSLGSTPESVWDGTAAAGALGYDATVRDLRRGCPADPSGALGLPPATFGAGIPFADAASADAFVDLSGLDVLGAQEGDLRCS